MQRHLLLLLSSLVCVMSPQRPRYSFTQFTSGRCFIARGSANVYAMTRLRSAARSSDQIHFSSRFIRLPDLDVR